MLLVERQRKLFRARSIMYIRSIRAELGSDQYDIIF